MYFFVLYKRCIENVVFNGKCVVYSLRDLRKSGENNI